MNMNITRLDDKLNAFLVAVAIVLAVGLDIDVLAGGASLGRGETQAQQMARAQVPQAAPATLVAAIQRAQPAR